MYRIKKSVKIKKLQRINCRQIEAVFTDECQDSLNFLKFGKTFFLFDSNLVLFESY